MPGIHNLLFFGPKKYMKKKPIPGARIKVGHKYSILYQLNGVQYWNNAPIISKMAAGIKRPKLSLLIKNPITKSIPSDMRIDGQKPLH